MATLLLSDLHLPPEPSKLRDRFLRFLDGPARGADAVYLLGDLFEYWIGDDVGMPVYAAEIAGLKALTARGVPVWFQHGNRDFLVGREFFRATGVRALRDPQIADLYGTPTLLSHGDLLCTDDIAYQRWRRFSRNPAAQWVFMRLSRARRERIAGGLRSGSDTAKRNKAENIMDVNPAAVRAAFARFGTGDIIHGHTHRPAEHRVGLDRGEGRRTVLADWRPEHCEFLQVDADGRRQRVQA